MVQRGYVVIASQHARIPLELFTKRVFAFRKNEMDDATERKDIHGARLTAVGKTFGRLPAGGTVTATATTTGTSTVVIVQYRARFKTRAVDQVHFFRDAHIGKFTASFLGDENIRRF